MDSAHLLRQVVFISGVLQARTFTHSERRGRGGTARRNHPKESPVDPDYSTHAKVFSIRLRYYKTGFSGFIS